MAERWRQKSSHTRNKKYITFKVSLQVFFSFLATKRLWQRISASTSVSQLRETVRGRSSSQLQPLYVYSYSLRSLFKKVESLEDSRRLICELCKTSLSGSVNRSDKEPLKSECIRMNMVVILFKTAAVSGASSSVSLQIYGSRDRGRLFVLVAKFLLKYNNCLCQNMSQQLRRS